MNEQDIINRLARMEKMLESINGRLLATQQQFAAQLLQRPQVNWPCGYPVYAALAGEKKDDSRS